MVPTPSTTRATAFTVGRSVAPAQANSDTSEGAYSGHDAAVVAVVVYNWQIEQRWDQEHHLEIAVARVQPDGSVETCSERWSCWPFWHEEIVGKLQSVGLKIEATMFDPDAEGYRVIAEQG